MVLRSAFVILTLAIAIYLPYFALLMAFTGSLAGVPLSIILPCIFHLQLKWASMTWLERSTDVFIFVMGLACTFSGLYMSAFDLDSASKNVWINPQKMGELSGNVTDVLTSTATSIVV